MARFFTRRDNRPVSGYVPLPLDLMQKKAQEEQNKLDSLKNDLSGDFSFKGKAIEQLTSSPGQLSEDYRTLIEHNKYIADNVNKLTKDLMEGGDVNSIKRKLMEVKNYKTLQEQQNGTLSRLTESREARDKYEAEVMKMDATPDWKKHAMYLADLEYERTGQYKGNIYQQKSVPEQIKVDKMLQDNAKAIELNTDFTSGEEGISTRMPGFLEHKKAGRKVKSEATIAVSSLDLMQSDDRLNASILREIDIRAKQMHDYVLNKTGDAKRAKDAYNTVVKNEQDAMYLQARDADGKVINKYEMRASEKDDPKVFDNTGYEVEGVKMGTIAGQYVTKAARDFNVKETMSDNNLSALPGLEFGAGGKVKTGTIIEDRYGYDSGVTKTHNELKTDAASLDKQIEEGLRKLNAMGNEPSSDRSALLNQLNELRGKRDNYRRTIMRGEEALNIVYDEISNDVTEQIKSNQGLETYAKASGITYKDKAELDEKVKKHVKANLNAKGSLSLQDIGNRTKLNNEVTALVTFILAPVGIPYTAYKMASNLSTKISSNEKINNILEQEYTAADENKQLFGDAKTETGNLLTEYDKVQKPSGVQKINGEKVEIDDKKTSAPGLIYPSANNGFKFQIGWTVYDKDGKPYQVTKTAEGGFQDQAISAALNDIDNKLASDSYKTPKFVKDLNERKGQLLAMANIKGQFQEQFTSYDKKGDEVVIRTVGSPLGEHYIRFVKRSDDKYGFNTYRMVDEQGNDITQGGKEMNLVGEGDMFNAVSQLYYNPENIANMLNSK